jgi:hypothetical protein
LDYITLSNLGMPLSHLSQDIIGFPDVDTMTQYFLDNANITWAGVSFNSSFDGGTEVISYGIHFRKDKMPDDDVFGDGYDDAFNYVDTGMFWLFILMLVLLLLMVNNHHHYFLMFHCTDSCLNRFPYSSDCD